MLIDGSPLPLPALAAVAARKETVELSDAARARAERSNTYAEQVSKERHVYGRSTGVGANRQVPVAEPAAFALALLRSHASAAGPERSAERIRAMLAVRLNQLAAGRQRRLTPPARSPCSPPTHCHLYASTAA